ncbi:MAG: Hsp70 family protein [Pirellulales bacterium]
MSASSPLAVGIDLGTTFSVVARLDDTGRPVTLVNAEGDILTPSVVLFDGDDVVVGKEALKAIATEPEQVAACAKRDVGHKAFHKAVGGKQFPPEVIEAWILKKLRDDAARQIGPFHRVVITVPAYFDEVRRKATQDAGYMAGLEVLDIINEPTAAAICYGFQHGFLSQDAVDDASRKILVYDLGGGTFDATAMDIRGTDFTAMAIDGDVGLGGQDWDERLVRFVVEEFTRLHGIDPTVNATAAGRLWRDCEDAKRTLSARSKATVSCDYQGRAAQVEITREHFEEITRDLLDRTRFVARQVLQAAGLAWSDLDRVLLVGGSTRMPMVRAMLRELSGKEPDASLSADEAVAHGAALHAGLLLAKKQGVRPRFGVTNVNSHSLGVVATDPATGRKRNAVVIPRNTPLPVATRRIFKTRKAGQESILVEIIEGESASPEECTPIGRCVIRDLPPGLPVHTPIDVRFGYKPNGRLYVMVKVPGTDLEARHKLARENGLSREDLQAWRKRIAGIQLE